MSGIVLFILIFFILILFIGLTPYLYPMILDNKIWIECESNYIIECLLLDLTLPIIIIVLLSLLIGYIARGVKG